MLRRIKLYGPLAKFIGRKILQADVATAAEAVRFLVANWPAVEKHMADQHYRVVVGNHDLSLDELHDPTGQHEIRIIPVVAGAGAFGRILAGVALIALSFIPGLQSTAIFGSKLTVGGALLAVGSNLLLGGVAQLLTPVPTLSTGIDSNQDPRKSYSFSGIQQTSRQGLPVPICYGLVLTGSVVISAGIDTDQVRA